MSKYGIQVRGTSPILRNGQGFTPGHKPQLSTYDKGGRVGFKRGGGISETSKKQFKENQKKTKATTKKVLGHIKDTVTLKKFHEAAKKASIKALKEGRDLHPLPRRRDKKFGGGRANLLEEVGRIDAEKMNPNRRAEKHRVIGELNRGYNKGGRVGLKKGGDDKWIQKATASIKKRGTEGKCTPITKKGCTGRAKALAKTFKKMAKKRKS